MTVPSSGRPHRSTAFTLLEMVLGLAFGAMLVLGLVEIVSAASAAGLLQQNQLELQDQERVAAALLSSTARRAGFSPQPWDDSFEIGAIGSDSVDGVSLTSDRLGLRDWSDRNCYGNRNPDEDAAGRAQFYLRVEVFDLNGSAGLTRECRYGPTTTTLVTQIRRQAAVSGVETFQVLYGEDVDHDGNADRWVTAGGWDDPADVLGLRIGLLLASSEQVLDPTSQSYAVLDRTVAAPADGRLREALEFTVALGSRAP